MAKKKKKNKESLTCKYCSSFANSRDRSINETEDKEKYSRHCSMISARVLSNTNICEYFTLNKYFWCDECSYRMIVDSCLSRLTCHCLGYKSVKKCKQRKLLKEYLNDRR